MHSGVRFDHGVVGLRLLVQSSEHDAAYLEARVRARKRDAGTDTALDKAKSSDTVRAPRSHLVRGKEADEAAHQFVTDETRWPILETSLKVGTVVLKRRGEDETGTQVDEGQLQPRDPIVR